MDEGSQMGDGANKRDWSNKMMLNTIKKTHFELALPYEDGPVYIYI